MGFAELHFHLLPGIDDGPASIEESVELARLAMADGTDTIVATPHVNSYFPTDVGAFPEQVEAVAERLRKERVPIEVLCGGELDPEMVGRLSQAELETIAQGPPRHRWVLLEAPLTGVDEHFAVAVEELRDRGFGVVIAHPERSLAESPGGARILAREIEAGAGIQLNAWSLAGLNGESARAHALELLHVTPRVAISSDAHGVERMPSLREALDLLTEMGQPDPTRFIGAVPHALLERGLPGRSGAIAA